MPGNWGLIRPGLGGGGPQKTQPLSVGFKMAQAVRNSSSGSCQRAMFAESQGHHVMARANPLVQPPTQRTPSREIHYWLSRNPRLEVMCFWWLPVATAFGEPWGSKPFLSLYGVLRCDSYGFCVACGHPVRPLGLHRSPHPLTWQ